MKVKVDPIHTSPPWWEIAGFHPRDLQRQSDGKVQTIQGRLVDDGTKAPGAPRKAERPFRIHAPTTADLGDLAMRLAQLVEAGENLWDVRLE